MGEKSGSPTYPANSVCLRVIQAAGQGFVSGPCRPRYEKGLTGRRLGPFKDVHFVFATKLHIYFMHCANKSRYITHRGT